MASSNRALMIIGVAILYCVCCPGCTPIEPPRFHLNLVEMAKNEVPRDQQQDIMNVLTAMFGTPNEPYVLPETGLDMRKLRMAAGPVASDQHGNEIGLFRRHCAHCHGVTGDGAGPTAAFLNPYPRDYRQGIFKFKSTVREGRPTVEDLHMILVDGIPGTAMPSFRLLPPDQLDALVEYVVYLSMRGNTELELISAAFDLDEGEKLDTSHDFLVGDLLTRVAEKWHQASDEVIAPNPDRVPSKSRTARELASSIDAGRHLFYSARANCFTCHGNTALGDGQTDDYDYWNKQVKEVVDANASLTPARLGALPVRTIRPRNLRRGIYRGGRRPLDIYRRVHAGINGAPMPGAGRATPEATVGLSETEIWNIVDYVLSLPFEPMSEPPQLAPGLKRERM